MPQRSSSSTINADAVLLDRPKVLVVDDEPVILGVLRSILRRGGYETITAQSGQEALEILERMTPDLVMLDVIMSPVDGFEVLRQIRKTHRDTELPVLMVTGDSERESYIRAFREGANDYLTKPIDTELTLSRVSLLLRLRMAQVELERSQEQYRLAAEGARIGLWDWDVARKELFMSTRGKEMLGYSDDELSLDVDGWMSRVHPQDRSQFNDLLKRRRPSDRERFECEVRILHRDSSYRWMQCSGVIQTDDNGSPRRLAGSLADITKGKVRDVLTGLPNRLLFEERLEQASKHAERNGHQSAVLFLDLDKFKHVNDNLGHEAGDLVLCNVARRLEKCLSRSSVLNLNGNSSTCIARRGGDEFTLIIDPLPDIDLAISVAHDIISAISEPFSIGPHLVSIGVSIGISTLDSANCTPSEVLRQADTAMYHAKLQGRGCCRVYDPGMQAIAMSRLTLESDIRNALKGEQFFILYQPIVSLATGQIDGFEALCRWNHPRDESVGPEVFIPILDSLGLIGHLGEYVLKVAARQIQDWNHKLSRTRPLTVTLNASTREFSQPHFQNHLLELVRDVGVDPSMIRLEVTEGTLMENPASALQSIRELRAHNVGVGLDDFGTGYSSLAFLHRLPLDLLKIDKSFVQSMQLGNESYEIVRNIVSLARGLSLDVVAEGVETAEQHRILSRLGCTHGQGYYYSRPKRAEEITPWLLSGKPVTPQMDMSGSELLFGIPNDELNSLLEIDPGLKEITEMTSRQ